jgi:hypothetical protein
MREDWTLKEVVEPQTGKIHRLYWYKGKICKRVPLDTPMARQLAGYVLIEKDLRSASVWLEEIERIRGDDATLDQQGSRNSKDRGRYNLVKGLFVAALTFYGKAFAQCEGRRVKLERRQIDTAFHEAHDDAIAFRNNFAAHSGAKLLERAEIAVVLPPKPKAGVRPRVYREMSQPDFVMTRDGDKSFAELIEHVRQFPLKKMDQLSDKLLQEEVMPKGYAHWAAK